MTFEGKDVLATARPHIGEKYVFGARAQLDNPDYKGPWDCAEFATWCVKQTYGILFGTTDYGTGPDPFSGAWFKDAASHETLISLEDAARTPGAVLLRKPGEGRIGHVAFSVGNGDTIEAHSTRTGVIQGKVYKPGRVWHGGCLIPGVSYEPNDAVPEPEPEPLKVIERTHPFRRGAYIEKLQKALEAAGVSTGGVDGIYGFNTEKAVINFQIMEGLHADGRVGPVTAQALDLGWPPKDGQLDQQASSMKSWLGLHQRA